MRGEGSGLNNQPIRLPGLKPGVCSGLILSGAFYPDLKIGVWRRRTYQQKAKTVRRVGMHKEKIKKGRSNDEDQD